LIVVACISAAAILTRRDRTEPAATRSVAPSYFWPVVANVIAVVWMSYELTAELNRRFVDAEQPVQFGLTALWAVYAAVLLAVGVATKVRWARLAAVAGLFRDFLLVEEDGTRAGTSRPGGG
jgi:putative copper export protein